MGIHNLYRELLSSAYEELSQMGNSTDGLDSVCILIDESLGDCFSFSLKKNRTQYLWLRKQWDKRNDMRIASDPIEQLKYIGQKILPSISIQHGVTRLDEANKIFRYAENLDLDEKAVSNVIVLDGVGHTVKISLSKGNAEFKWNALPPGWEPLEELVNLMLDLNRKLA